MLRRISSLALPALLVLSSIAFGVAACVSDPPTDTVCAGSGCDDSGADGSSVVPANDAASPDDAGTVGPKDAGPVSDGACTHPCNGDVVWLRGFGSTVGDSISEVKVDGAGNMYILGSAGGPFPAGVDGGGPTVAANRFVMKLDKDGNAVWTKAISGSTPQVHIAVSSTTLFVAGMYFKNTNQTAPIAWGGNDTSLPTNVGSSGYDIFVLETDLDGNQLAVTRIGADSYDEMDAIGVDTNGAPVIFGIAAAQINFGGKIISQGPFVMELSAALGATWVCTVGVQNVNSGARARAITSLPGNGIYIAGQTLGNTTWCGKSVSGGTQSEAFLVHLQSDGTLSAGTSNPTFAYGNQNVSQTTDLSGLAVGTNDAGAGGVYIAGAFEGSVSVGGISQTILADDGGLTDTTPASYLGLLDKTSNLPLSSRGILDNPYSHYTLAVDGFGGVAVAGFFKGTVDFGGSAPFTSAGDTDGVIALYDPLLKKAAWSYRLGGPVTDSIMGVGTDALGNVYAAGQWQGTGDFPNGKTMMSNGGVTNLFVMKLAH